MCVLKYLHIKLQRILLKFLILLQMTFCRVSLITMCAAILPYIVVHILVLLHDFLVMISLVTITTFIFWRPVTLIVMI